MAALDRLEIQIEAHANKANQSLELLVKKLDRISASLSGVNSRGLSTLGSGVNKLANAMGNMNANTRTADFSRLANNLSKLNNVDTSKFHTIASAINALNTSLSRVGPISQSSVQISEIAKNLSKLGGANIQRAITNIPQLATAMRDLMQTLSTAPRVNENVIRLTNALASFASNGNRAGTAANNISNNLNAYHQTAVRSTKSTANLSVSLGKLYASAFLVIRVFKLLGKAIESSMDMTETVNYMNVVLKKMSSEWESAGYSSGESYTKALQSEMNELTGKLTGFVPDESGNLSAYNTASLGMNLNDVIKYQASFAQLASSMGLTAKSSTNLSKALTMLGADISSVKNMDLDVVFQKLASGLVGQSRAVRDLGGEITQVTLQEYAMKYGLTQSIQAMNQATKAQLRLLAMLDQLDFAFGDMASTINSAANSYRVFTNQAKNLSIILGNLFIPIISKVLPYINGLVIALQRLFTWIGGKLFGAGWLEDVNTSLGGASDGMGDLIGGTDDYEESLNDANAAAKKLKSAVSGIDELNINAPDESAGGGANKSTGGGGGIPELDTAISDALAEYEKVWNDAFDRMENKAQKFADNIERFFNKIWNVAEPTKKAISNLWDNGLSKLQNFSNSTLKDFYNNFLVPVGNWMLGSDAGLPRLFNIINNMLVEVNWGKLRNSLYDLYKSMSALTMFVFDGLFDFYEFFLAPIGKWVFSSALPQLADIISNFVKNINWEKLNQSFERFWKALFPFAQSIGQGMINFFSRLAKLGAAFISTVVPLAINALATALELIDPRTVEHIGGALGFLLTTYLGFRAIKSVSAIIKTAWPALYGKEVLNGLKKVIKSASTALQNYQ